MARLRNMIVNHGVGQEVGKFQVSCVCRKLRQVTAGNFSASHVGRKTRQIRFFGFSGVCFQVADTRSSVRKLRH